MDYEIVVIVDTNDADYNMLTSKISEANLEIIKPLIAAIAQFKPYTVKVGYTNLDWTHKHNYPHGEFSPRGDLGEKNVYELYPEFTEETHALLMEYLPHGEYGFHSIKSIEIAPFITKTKLL